MKIYCSRNNANFDHKKFIDKLVGKDYWFKGWTTQMRFPAWYHIKSTQAIGNRVDYRYTMCRYDAYEPVPREVSPRLYDMLTGKSSTSLIPVNEIFVCQPPEIYTTDELFTVKEDS